MSAIRREVLRPPRRAGASLAGIVFFACISASGAPRASTEQMPPSVVSTPHLSLELAVRAAQAAMAACRANGFQVAVTLVDRGGHPEAILRDTLAMDLTLPVSREKAYTAMLFGKPTSRLQDTVVGRALSRQPNLLFAAGGVPIWAQSMIIGGLGVSGAPTGEADELCAEHGIESIRGDLDFAQ
jgi:uncharacterized protein GlcG (DUF336 family)